MHPRPSKLSAQKLEIIFGREMRVRLHLLDSAVIEAIIRFLKFDDLICMGIEYLGMPHSYWLPNQENLFSAVVEL